MSASDGYFLEILADTPIDYQIPEPNTGAELEVILSHLYVSGEVPSPVVLEIPVAEGLVKQENFIVQPANPGLDGAGIWVQTAINGDPESFTFWIEDGL